jgi:two-component system, cell cycle sensor histidine kinase and response regulator CckA
VAGEVLYKDVDAEGVAMHVPTTTRLEESNEWSAITGNKTLGSAETILLVEDEAFVREVTCQVLRAAGYQVLTASNAAEALQLYDQRSDEVELLLTDVVLAGESGRALAYRLRQQNPELNILLVTGYAEQMGLQEAMCKEILAKPFSTGTLLHRVRQLLDREIV